MVLPGGKGGEGTLTANVLGSGPQFWNEGSRHNGGKGTGGVSGVNMPCASGARDNSG